jgi:hypothetical protein
MHSDIHDQSTPVTDERVSGPDDVDCCCDEDDACGMIAELNESDREDACCCC